MSEHRGGREGTGTSRGALGAKRRRRPLIPARPRALTDAARRELTLHGQEATATILEVRRVDPADSGDGAGEHLFRVRVCVEGAAPYETAVVQWIGAAERDLVAPGRVVGCRVDPGDRARLVLRAPDPSSARADVVKILADGRRADATVLACAPVATGWDGRGDPVLRLDLELRAWDEPRPWRVRAVQAVPLTALALADLGARLVVGFLEVDRGESVAVDWAASLAGADG